eukprot:scaffold6208_cov19-Prasinocladus_malaysianus.AAC.1
MAEPKIVQCKSKLDSALPMFFKPFGARNSEIQWSPAVLLAMPVSHAALPTMHHDSVEKHPKYLKQAGQARRALTRSCGSSTGHTPQSRWK